MVLLVVVVRIKKMNLTMAMITQDFPNCAIQSWLQQSPFLSAIPYFALFKVKLTFLVASYATLHHALSVLPSVCWSVRHTLLFFMFLFVL